MTTLVSYKVHHLTGWRDIPKVKSQAFHFLKKTYLQFLRQGQKLAVILENNVVQNLKLEKNYFYPKLASIINCLVLKERFQ